MALKKVKPQDKIQRFRSQYRWRGSIYPILGLDRVFPIYVATKPDEIEHLAAEEAGELRPVLAIVAAFDLFKP